MRSWTYAPKVNSCSSAFAVGNDQNRVAIDWLVKQVRIMSHYKQQMQSAGHCKLTHLGFVGGIAGGKRKIIDIDPQATALRELSEETAGKPYCPHHACALVTATRAFAVTATC